VDERWVPIFPNANYTFSRRVYQACVEGTKQGANPPGCVLTQNCQLIMEAGQPLLVDDDFTLDNTVCLTLTPAIHRVMSA